jgi:hypothetical protein
MDEVMGCEGGGEEHAGPPCAVRGSPDAMFISLRMPGSAVRLGVDALHEYKGHPATYRQWKIQKKRSSRQEGVRRAETLWLP